MYAIIPVHSKVREVCDVDQNGDSRKANTNMGKRFQELFRCKLDRAKRGRGEERERERDLPIASGEAFVAEKYHANQCQEKRLAYSVVCLTLC